MAVEPLLRIDRRHRRRQETIEQVVEVAMDVMAEQGAAGLSLGEVARRMGIRPPSLYSYFATKNALYDAIFARGWRELMDAVNPLVVGSAHDVSEMQAYVLERGAMFVRWAIEHPVYSQLMFWRAVPNYEPSMDAYAPAVESFEKGRVAFHELHARGLFRVDADVEDAFRTWTVLITGVITQQLANAPGESFDDGIYTSRLPQLVAMHLAHYGPPRRIRPPGRGSHADARRSDR